MKKEKETIPVRRYESLGLRPVINAEGMKTGLGGTLMSEGVMRAMQDASGAFVDMWELQRVVSARIASLTRNEAALVCTGAAGGIFLATLACITGPDPAAIGRLVLRGPEAFSRREVIVQAAQRNPFLPSVTLAGARLVEIGNVLQTLRSDFEGAFSPDTAAVIYFPGKHLETNALDLDLVIAVSHDRGVPVIVDAAAQLPPRSSLWQFTKRGADLVIFSGGKDLRGPQSTGLIVGRPNLIEACSMHAAPNQYLARGMKVGKEEMLGLLTAVEEYLERDEEAERSRCERIVSDWVAGLAGLHGLTARRDFPGTDGRPLPRALVEFEASLAPSGERVQQMLLAGEPSIAVRVAGSNSVYLNPELLDPAQAALVLEAVRALTASSPDGRRVS